MKPAMNKKLRNARIIAKLPDISGRRGNLPEGLTGATIVGIGTIRGRALVEGGGLVIDYRPAGSIDSRRVVLAFNEIGMWPAFAS